METIHEVRSVVRLARSRCIPFEQSVLVSGILFMSLWGLRLVVDNIQLSLLMDDPVRSFLNQTTHSKGMT